jgi:hypothetical protein
MFTIAIIIGIVGGIILIIFAVLEDQLPKLYKKRNCQGIYWRRKYPEVSKDEIDKFLRYFVDAFAFKETHKCQFKPEDKVMDIYDALYPTKFSKLSGDAMELEELATFLEEEYEIDFEKLWYVDIALGDIFKEIIRKKSQQNESANQLSAPLQAGSCS